MSTRLKPVLGLITSSRKEVIVICKNEQERSAILEESAFLKKYYSFGVNSEYEVAPNVIFSEDSRTYQTITIRASDALIDCNVATYINADKIL